MRTRRMILLPILPLLAATSTSSALRLFGTRGGIGEGKCDVEESVVISDGESTERDGFDRQADGFEPELWRIGFGADAAVVESFFASSDKEPSARLTDVVRARASDLVPALVSTRRLLHRHPELMYREEVTSAAIQRVLHELDIDYTTGWAVNAHPDIIPGPGGYGVVADVGTGGPPCVLLRADMDALPVFERTEGVDGFRSRNDGTMHACGHDGHTTMLLGAAAVLKGAEDSINGTVRLMFQPAEEGGAGAKRMREEGVLDAEPRVQHAYGLHVWPSFPSGAVASRPGPLFAAQETFEILISGVGGHAAMPHQTIDPIVAASAIVMNLQTLISRGLSPLESGVCSVTQVDAGDGAFNVIPASAKLRGTVRSLRTETLVSLRGRVESMARSTAEAHGCTITVTYSPDFYPPLVNDPSLFPFASSVAALVSDDGVVRDAEPTMGAEDFAFVAESVPSAFFMLGQGSGMDPPTNLGLHHPHFALDEDVMSRGVELHVNLALRTLKKLAEETQVESEKQ